MGAKETIEFLSAQSPEELKLRLESLTLPYRLVAIYSQGGAHLAWIMTEQKKITKSKEIHDAYSSKRSSNGQPV